MATLLDLFHNMKQKVVGSLPRVVHSTPTAAAVSEEDRQVWDQFEAWMVKYGKSYDSVVEKEKRFEIFKQCVRDIEKHNALDKPWKQGLNEFSDLTLQEFKRIYAGVNLDREEQILGPG